MFYIASRGSTANHWLAKVLSKHPQIVCFRSTRSFPPFEPGSGSRAEMPVELFFDGLLECTRATFNEKIFGSIHGYHGVTAKEACEKRDGIFSYIVRHPISRIHSAYIYHLIHDIYQPSGFDINTDDAHERVCSLFSEPVDVDGRFQGSNRKNLIQRFNVYFYTFCQRILERFLPLRSATILSKIKIVQRKIDNVTVGPSKAIVYTFSGNKSDSNGKTDLVLNETSRAAKLFVSVCDEFMSDDSILFSKCSRSAGIVMEEMVRSSEYFRKHLWPRVAPEINLTDQYLAAVFAESRINVHRDNPITPAEIWKSWPNQMKQKFRSSFERSNLSAVCSAFDYDISFM